MSSKYSPLTSTLLVRKGEAAPSRVKRKPRRRANGTEKVERNIFAVDEAAGEEVRSITVTLSAQEYETLTLLAVKKGITRQALAQSAMNAYLEWLISERGES